MFATAIWVHARFEADIRALVSGDNGLCVVTEKLRFAPWALCLLVLIDLDDVRVAQINVQFLEPIRRAP
jgi:hypothetical protein